MSVSQVTWKTFWDKFHSLWGKWKDHAPYEKEEFMELQRIAQWIESHSTERLPQEVRCLRFESTDDGGETLYAIEEPDGVHMFIPGRYHQVLQPETWAAMVEAFPPVKKNG